MGKINVIVENFDKNNADDEETVIIQTNVEIIEETDEKITDFGENKGHLVEQILEQIQEGNSHLINKSDIDWQSDGVFIVQF